MMTSVKLMLLPMLLLPLVSAVSITTTVSTLRVIKTHKYKTTTITIESTSCSTLTSTIWVSPVTSPSPTAELPSSTSSSTSSSTTTSTTTSSTASAVTLTLSSSNVKTISNSPASATLSELSSPVTTLITTLGGIGTTIIPSMQLVEPTETAAVANISAVQACFDVLGGLVDTTVEVGCGCILDHVEDCYNQLAPWTDPYDSTQSAKFQACVCETSKDKPFSMESTLYRNFTGCARCLLAADTPEFNYISGEMQGMRNFCHAEEPNAFIFLRGLMSWLKRGHMIPTATTNIAYITSLNALFTTKPPLANLAWGPSAPYMGSLEGVTPSMTTFTTTSSSGTATMTELVKWIHTKGGSSFNGAVAASQQSAEASGDLASGVSAVSMSTTPCKGRGPCSLNGGEVELPPSKLLGVCGGVVMALAAGVM